MNKPIEDIAKVLIAAAATEAAVQAAENAPRDWARPPKNINRKDGKRPNRKRGVVSKDGDYYQAVTGNLKRSIGYEIESGGLSARVGVAAHGPASAYARAQEFGVPWRLPPRSFVRMVEDNPEIQKKVLEMAVFAARQYLQ